MDLKDRLRLFYTSEGIFGQSALALALQALEPFKRLHRKYEEADAYEPEAHRFPQLVLDALYDAFDKQYRTFFDAIDNEPISARASLQSTLIDYHHEVVHQLERERAELWRRRE